MILRNLKDKWTWAWETYLQAVSAFTSFNISSLRLRHDWGVCLQESFPSLNTEYQLASIYFHSSQITLNKFDVNVENKNEEGKRKRNKQWTAVDTSRKQARLWLHEASCEPGAQKIGESSSREIDAQL